MAGPIAYNVAADNKTPIDSSKAWSIKFDNIDFTDYLFTTGTPISQWAQISKGEVLDTDSERSIKMSSISNSGYNIANTDVYGDSKSPTIVLRENSDRLDYVIYAAGLNGLTALTSDESKALYSI